MLIKIDYNFHEHLTDTEKQVINFINANVKKISSMSIMDIAEQTYSSPATVSRTIKKCGISGFAELRYLLTKKMNTEKQSIEINEIFNKSRLEVTNTIDHLSIDTILKIVKEIKKAKRIYLLSRGLTELVAQEFSLKLQILGYNVFSITDPAVMEKVTDEIKQDELCFIFSLSGMTKELVSSAENAASLGARIVCCTCGERNAPLVKLSQVAVFGYKHQHVSIKNIDATSRFPLYVLSRIIVDYLILQQQKSSRDCKEKTNRKYPCKE
ncbi:MurR/RpiR family transcriptional regulator [Pectinatus sottacetonis]|uniref:MurR/RpiR family transcriptional regulator n=1 Tax=Pectinatus sottacetonis TaxID=1002795 RepID=UPI0018C6F342|nr:MurR/RpiR family transcriptional regulator [Pectinatus sottacetonis]